MSDFSVVKKEIGSMFREYRKSKGITIDQIVEWSELSKPTIISIENSNRNYQFDTLLKYLVYITDSDNWKIF